jgi:hypothetical protein
VSYSNLQLVIGGAFIAIVAALVLGEGLLHGGFRVAAFPFFGLKVRPSIAFPIYLALLLGGVVMILMGIGALG